MSKNKSYNIGDIVTIKSHPLLKNFTLKNNKLPCPPLLLIKEVLFENKKKKLFSDEIPKAKIADNLKYICVYFNDKKSEFVEITLYHSYLASYKDLKFDRELDETGNKTKSKISLIEEVKDYSIKKYKFGRLTQLKTCKLESRKKIQYKKKRKIRNYLYATPDFVLTGIKREVTDGLFYDDRKPKRKVSEIMYKVMWFNHIQNKFSEKYLPKEFFIEPLDLAEKPKLNEKPKN